MPDKLTTANAWYDLHAAVRAFVARRVRDAHAADDITQDVMLKVQSQLASQPPAAEKMDAWVFRVARNAVIDHYRARRDQSPVDASDAVAIEREEDPAAELSRCIRQIMLRLPPEYAEALTLTDLDGLSQQQLADRIGLSLSAAKSRVQRAREKLHAMMLDCCDIERNRAGAVVDYQTTPRTPNYCDLSEEGSSGPCR
ncbi:MAG: polymerase sigma-70 factor, subfamily [Humisphaera sp.]|nr:polymerase sigma-70 factor, subfamily [Humisphaera sp.]